MSLFDRIFFVGAFFILNLLFYSCSGVCSIIPFQRCRLILCNIEGQSEFSTIANSSIDCNIKKMFEPTFLQTYFLIEHCYLSCNVVVPLIMLLAALIYLKPKVHNVATISAFALFFVTCIHLWTVNWLYSPLLILLSGDVEINPGPRHNSGEFFSICHWNLNSVLAYNYTKLSSLKAFIAVHKFDIICLSETYLDSSGAPDDDNLLISGYSLVRSDHPSNNKRGGVCVYYKTFLPMRVLDIQYLHECINFELKIGDKLCNFVALYRSPSQTQDEFEKFSDNLELNLGTLSQKIPF